MNIRKFIFPKREPHYFRKDAEGKDLFYPWSYPGEGFYIDEEQKKQLSIFFIIFLPSVIVGFVGPDIAVHYDLIDSYASIYIEVAIVWIIFPLWYVYRMRTFTGNMKPHIVVKKDIPKIFYALLFFLCVQIFTIGVGIYAYPKAPVFVAPLLLFSILYAATLTVLTVKAFRNKGYFLQKTLSRT